MAVTLFLGPLALVAAPVAGMWLAMVLARHCQQQAPPRRYWVYVLSTATAYGLIALAAGLPGGPVPTGHEPSLAGAQAAVAGGVGIFLSWALRSAGCWARPSLGSDQQQPNYSENVKRSSSLRRS